MPLLIMEVEATDSPDDNFSPVFAWLQEIGLSFQNPINNRVTSIAAGKGQVETTVEEVMSAVRNRDPSNIQLWFSGGGDLFLGWSENKMTFFLGGKTIEEKRIIIRAIIDGFLNSRENNVKEWKTCIGIDDVM
jgi:hypothetical protein